MINYIFAILLGMTSGVDQKFKIINIFIHSYRLNRSLGLKPKLSTCFHSAFFSALCDLFFQICAPCSNSLWDIFFLLNNSPLITSPWLFTSPVFCKRHQILTALKCLTGAYVSYNFKELLICLLPMVGPMLCLLNEQMSLY